MQSRTLILVAFLTLTAVLGGAGLIYYTGRSHGVDSTNSYWESKVSKMVEETRKKETRLTADIREAKVKAEQEHERLEAINTDAISKSERLLKQFANQCNRITRPSDTPAHPTGGVPERMFERLLERARLYARQADEARSAGLACERQYYKTQQELRK